MDIQAEKRALRRAVRARIAALDPGVRRHQEAELAAILPDLPGFAAAGTILLYATAFPEEIATGPMLAQILRRGQRLVCPRVDRIARRLSLHEIEDPEADLTPGAMGIPEPRAGLREVEPGQIDWALVPGLAFDTHGFRLGRGGGYYDRLLPTLRADAPRWALALAVQWVDAVPNELHDQALDGVAGPGKVVTRPGPRPSAGSHRL